jgi:hypothetical protein
MIFRAAVRVFFSMGRPSFESQASFTSFTVKYIIKRFQY